MDYLNKQLAAIKAAKTNKEKLSIINRVYMDGLEDGLLDEQNREDVVYGVDFAKNPDKTVMYDPNTKIITVRENKKVLLPDPKKVKKLDERLKGKK